MDCRECIWYTIVRGRGFYKKIGKFVYYEYGPCKHFIHINTTLIRFLKDYY